MDNCIKNYKSHGSTAPQLVKKRIAYWEKETGQQFTTEVKPQISK